MLKTLGGVWRFIVGAPATVHQVVAALTRFGVPSATITTATGLWQGQTESAVVIDIAGQWSGEMADTLAEFLRAEFSQQAVYAEHKGTGYLVEVAP